MPEEKTGTLDIESLKTKDSLSEEETSKVADAAYEEMEVDNVRKKATEEGKDPDVAEKEYKDSKAKPEKKEEGKKEGEIEPKSDEELLAAKDEDLDDGEKTKKKELLDIQKEEEETRILDAKEEDLSEEDKTRKPQILKDRETAKTTAFEEAVKAYAKESNMSEDEARQDLESIKKVREKYKDDPQQLAKANLHIQRLYTKTEKDLKTLQEAKPPAQEITLDSVGKDIEAGIITIKGKKASKEQVIEAFRELHKDLPEDTSDEVVFMLVCKDVKIALEKRRETDLTELKTKAKEKKDDLISKLSDEDKKFLPEVQAIIDKTPAAQIMDEDFSIADMVLWAKGKKYDADIKETGEREFKRGQENAKIIADKPPVGGGASTTKKEKTGLKRTMSQREKDRALDMYDGQEMTEKEKFESYIDQFPKRDQEFEEK